jgi:hypothetical protein
MAHQTQRYRICLVNGVFVSGGIGDDGRVLPPRLFQSLAACLAEATGWRAWALWPYRTKRIFGELSFLTITCRAVHGYAAYLAQCVRDDLRDDPLESDEALAFVAYSGGVSVAQTAATLLRPAAPVGAFVFVGPALLPCKVPKTWAGGASVGCVLGAQDWIQGIYPRVPRPWHGELREGVRARIQAALPETTAYRTLPCDHWPGYFSRDMWPHTVSAVRDLLQPASVLEPALAAD